MYSCIYIIYFRNSNGILFENSLIIECVLFSRVMMKYVSQKVDKLFLY